MRLIIVTLACKGLLISDRCHLRFATLVEKKNVHKVHMNQLENCQARYRTNTWMGRTRTDSPDEFEPSNFDCIYFKQAHMLTHASYHCNSSVQRVIDQWQVSRALCNFGQKKKCA